VVGGLVCLTDVLQYSIDTYNDLIWTKEYIMRTYQRKGLLDVHFLVIWFQGV